jgi:hypothetical protein
MYNGHRHYFSGGNVRPGRDADHSPISSTEVKKGRGKFALLHEPVIPDYYGPPVALEFCAGTLCSIQYISQAFYYSCLENIDGELPTQLWVPVYRICHALTAGAVVLWAYHSFITLYCYLGPKYLYIESVFCCVVCKWTCILILKCRNAPFPSRLPFGLAPISFHQTSCRTHLLYYFIFLQMCKHLKKFSFNILCWI